MKNSSSPVIDLLMLSVILIWGMNFSVIKLIYAYFDPLAFNALRFTVSALTLALMLSLGGHSFRIERADILAVIGLGILSNTLYQFLFILGLARTKAGNGGLLMALTPIFAYLTGVFLRRERFSRTVLAGILLSFAGVAAVILLGGSDISIGATWKGDLMLLGAAFCWGCYTGSSSSLILKYGALRLSVLGMVSGTAALVPLSLPWVVKQDWVSIPLRAWMAFLYATFLAIVYCYFAWSYALSRIGVSRTAVYSNLTPLVVLLAAWAMLGERPTGPQIAGVFLILSGIFIVRSHSLP